MLARSAPLLAALGCGTLMALQSRANGTLSEHSGRPLAAALWSFGSGLVVLLGLVALLPSVRAALVAIPAALRAGRLRWWQCVGGAVGGLFVAAQSWTVPAVGVAVFSVAILGGQTLSGLLVDRVGLSPGGRHPVTAARAGFALLAVAGVAIAAAGRGGAGGSASWAPVLVALTVGALIAVQQALNGRVNAAVGQPLATTTQNFAVGVAVLVALALVEDPGGAWLPSTDAPWWSWLGGVCGIVFIAVGAWAVGEVGVLQFGLATVAGQLLTSLLLDVLDPGARAGVGPLVVLGVAVSLAAAAGAGVVAARARG